MILNLFLSVVLPITSQSAFDRLDERIDSVMATGAREVDVRFEPGTYFFQEGHLSLSGIEAPETTLRLIGDDTVLVGADDGEPYRFEKGYVDLSARSPVDVRQPVRRARGWPVKCLFRRGIYKIRCDEPDVSRERAEGMKVILSQWYVGAVYPVVEIRSGFLYFKREPVYSSGMWS